MAVVCAFLHRSVNIEVNFVNMCLLVVRIVNPQACSPSHFPGAYNEAHMCICLGMGEWVWGDVWSSVFLNGVMIKQCKYIRLGGESE